MLRRRTFTTGLAAVAASTALVTAGCDDDPLDLPGIPSVGEEPDHDRVVAALGDEQHLLAQVALVRRRHRTLRRLLADTEAVHQAHVDLLARAVDDADAGQQAGDDTRVPTDPRRAVAELVRAERDLAERHVATAMRSRSGVLARAVASMSAAAAQQAVVLADLTPDEESAR